MQIIAAKMSELNLPNSMHQSKTALVQVGNAGTEPLDRITKPLTEYSHYTDSCTQLLISLTLTKKPIISCYSVTNGLP